MSEIVRLPDFTITKKVNILSETQNWGLQQLNIPPLWKETQGEGQTCLVIDTGKPDHKDVVNNVLVDRCIDFTGEDLDDHNSHSTFCCSIIAAENDDQGVVGYAPKTKIITAKVLDSSGSGDLEWTNKALQYALDIRNEIQLISMSLGLDAYDETMHKLIQELVAENITVVCAAGNSGKRDGIDTVNYPARFIETLSVAAYDRHGHIAPFSSAGEEVVISFPGVDVYGCGLDQSYVYMSGTSMACPAAAGVVSLLLAKHRKQEAETGLNDCRTPQQVKEHFIKHAIDEGIPGRDRDWGWGILDIAKLFGPNDVQVNQIPQKLTWYQKLGRRIKSVFA